MSGDRLEEEHSPRLLHKLSRLTLEPSLSKIWRLFFKSLSVVVPRGIVTPRGHRYRLVKWGRYPTVGTNRQRPGGDK